MSAMSKARAAGAVGLATALGAWAPVAGAQVLEIGAGGAVSVYDAPSVFTSQGAAPIQVKPPAIARPGPARTAAPAAMTDAADAAALSPDLVEAVAWRESRGRPHLVSRAGAIGEMQLMPGTARSLGVDPRDTRQNYRGGAAYLSAMMRRYGGDLEKALAAYNAGPGAVDRYRGVPPFKETQAYVAAVMDRLSRRAEAMGE